MARALWSESLSFGLVNVPVQLVSAARDLDYHFHQLHEKDKVAIEQRRFCSKEDVEVAWEEVAHSYDLDGKQVVLTDEELASVQPCKTRTIDIDAFVGLEQIDPVYFDHPYFLIPAGDSEGTLRAYRLLVETMSRQQRAALGRPTGGQKPRKKQLENAVKIVEALSVDWDPAEHQDCYRERLKRVIDDKRKRRTIEPPKVEKEPEPMPDLMAALEQTLDRLRDGEAARA